MKKDNDCSTCYFRDKQDECPVLFELQGQLSSTGIFYCSFWVEEVRRHKNEKIPKNQNK